MWILEQCDRFSCLPGELMREDGQLLGLLEIEREVRGPDVERDHDQDSL